MRPTLPNHAALQVEPYGERRIQPGDVIVFCSPDSSATVVHRVVSVSRRGLVTRGDANDAADPWVLSAESVIGKVRHARAGATPRRIYGGPWGILVAAAARARRFSARLMVRGLRPLLPAIARRNFFTRLWAAIYKPKVVRFNDGGESSFFLIVRGRRVGRFDPEQGTWTLIRPFSSFVDVKVLQIPQMWRNSSSVSGPEFERQS